MILIKKKNLNEKTLRIHVGHVEVSNPKNQSLQKNKQKNKNNENVKIVAKALKKVKLASKTKQNRIVLVIL